MLEFEAPNWPCMPGDASTCFAEMNPGRLGAGKEGEEEDGVEADDDTVTESLLSTSMRGRFMCLSA